MNERIDTTAAIVAFFVAIISGAISSFKAHTVVHALLCLIVSGVSGLLCWLGCTQFNIPGPISAVCTGLAGHIGAEITRFICRKELAMIDHDTQQQPKPSFTEMMNSNIESDYFMEAITMNAKGEYEAYICTKRGNYLLGSFSTKEEAERAAQDAAVAQWNG